MGWHGTVGLTRRLAVRATLVLVGLSPAAAIAEGPPQDAVSGRQEAQQPPLDAESLPEQVEAGQTNPSLERESRFYCRDLDGAGRFRRHHVRNAYGYTRRLIPPDVDAVRLIELDEAYRHGVEDGRTVQRLETQADQGRSSYRRAMDDGYAAFTAGRYRWAARHFELAATLNQGDPSSRLCAAHALTALGHYDSAVRILRRAFDLEPRIVYLPVDIREAYGVRSDFEKHRESLRTAAEDQRESADLWLLLGYYYYFSDDVERASAALALAGTLRADDKLVSVLASAALPSASAAGSAPRSRTKAGDR